MDLQDLSTMGLVCGKMINNNNIIICIILQEFFVLERGLFTIIRRELDLR